MRKHRQKSTASSRMIHQQKHHLAIHEMCETRARRKGGGGVLAMVALTPCCSLPYGVPCTPLMPQGNTKQWMDPRTTSLVEALHARLNQFPKNSIQAESNIIAASHHPQQSLIPHHHIRAVQAFWRTKLALITGSTERENVLHIVMMPSLYSPFSM